MTMRRVATASMMFGVLVTLGCTGWPLGMGADAPAVAQGFSCRSGKQYQILAADVTIYKSGERSIPEGMMSQSGMEKTVILLDTCTGDSWFLYVDADMKVATRTTRWVPITH